MQFYDAHIHLAKISPKDLLDLKIFAQKNDYACLVNLSSGKEVQDFMHLKEAGLVPQKAKCSFGIHPQSLCYDDIDKDIVKGDMCINDVCKGDVCINDMCMLEDLLKKDAIVAIGECGFDFFSPALKATEQQQQKLFEAQLQRALQYKKPLVLHIRKAIDKVFFYSKQLKQLPLVVFHSYSGTLQQAQSILNHGIKAKFSFCKQIIRGGKKAIQTIKNLPCNLILCETDAPYQCLKGETYTKPTDIEKITKAIMSL